jgi:hypothetical protein
MGTRRVWVRVETRCSGQTETWWVDRQGSKRGTKRKKDADAWWMQERRIEPETWGHSHWS